MFSKSFHLHISLRKNCKTASCLVWSNQVNFNSVTRPKTVNQSKIKSCSEKITDKLDCSAASKANRLDHSYRTVSSTQGARETCPPTELNTNDANWCWRLAFVPDWLKPPLLKPKCNGICKTLNTRHSALCLVDLNFCQKKFSTKHPTKFMNDLEAEMNAIHHYLQTTWWTWPKGSALLFWRFGTKESIKAARDGWPVFFLPSVPFPSHKRKQEPMDNDLCIQLAAKVADNRIKNYVTPRGKTLSDVNYFGVTKATNEKGEVIDIRVVYNGTSC